MAREGFRRNAFGPPEWDAEARDSEVWVKCATSVKCILNLSIAASSVTDIARE